MKIRKFVPASAKNLIVKVMELVGSTNLAVPSRWVRRPTVEAGAEVCLFVTVPHDDALTEHSLFHARAWSAAGFQVVVIIAADDLETSWHDESLSFAAGILVRQNRGYDFGAWASAINQMPELRRASMVVTANDSVFGPLNSFAKMLARVREIDADVIGTTESFEYRRHFQSFLLFFKQTAVNHGAFWTFWKNVRTGGRALVIRQYETRLVQQLEQSGLKCVALIPSPPGKPQNQTLTRWRELLDEGFPYVKIALLRDNPLGVDLNGWEQELERRGYDARIALRHLGHSEECQ